MRHDVLFAGVNLDEEHDKIAKINLLKWNFSSLFLRFASFYQNGPCPILVWGLNLKTYQAILNLCIQEFPLPSLKNLLIKELLLGINEIR